ncbi:TonB-dependent receptor [Leptothoe sp. ISB3NOV94-8A]
MRQLYLLKSLCLAGLSWIFICSTAHAESVGLTARLDEESSTVSLVDAAVEANEDWLSQSPRSDIEVPVQVETLTQITDVRLVPTDSGVDLFLRASTGQLLPVSPSVVGNDLIADIPNAVLVLADGEQFQAVDLTDDIALVSVSNQPDSQVRVVISGVSEAPFADITVEETGLLFSVVQAATDNLAEENTLRIVVTAEKTSEVVQDVPISLTVLTEDELEDGDITTLDGIAGNTPNFSSFSATGSRSFTFYSMRGLSNQNFGSRDPVAFYVDDVPYDYGSFLDLDLPDLQQVEVLRGPQNTLYGRSSQAGVVNIITRKPTNELSFNGALGYGSEENLDLQAGVSGPIIEDELFYRLSGSFERRDGFYDNSFLDEEFDEKSGGTGRAQLRWTPTDAWDISINASLEDYQDGAYPLVLLDDDPFDIEQDFNGFSDLNTNSQSLKVAYLQPDFRVTSITTRRFSEQDALGEVDLTVADVLRSTSKLDSTVWTQELRLQSPEAAEQLQWIVGGYFESREFDNNGFKSIFGDDAAAVLGPMTIPGSSSINTADSRDTTWATFGQVSYRPIDPLSLTVGLRYENTDSELSRFDQVFRVPGFPDTSLATFEDVDQSSDALLPRFAIDYRLSPEATLYGSISRGYRPAGVNVFADGSEASLVFDAERSWNFEVGAKTTWFDDRLGVNLSLFHNPVDNYQVATFNPITLFTDSVNNADVSITGLEFDIRATPLEGLDLLAGLGLVDAEFTNFTDANTGVDFDGNSLPYAPELTYNVAAQYRAPFGLFGRLELQGVGKTFFDEANTLKQDAYALINARLGYEFDQYGVYLFANNLFDTRYIIQGFDIGGQRAGSFGAPATYGVQFKSNF